MPTYIITENTTAQNGTGTQYTGVVETKIQEVNPTTNFGTATSLDLDKYASNDHTHGVIRFDGLSNISSSETVTSATLYLYQASTLGSSTYSYALRRVLQAWTESGATWNTYDGTNNWNTSGCLGAGTDRLSTTESVTAIASTTGQYYALDCTSLVSDIVDGTISSDEGFHLERNDTGEDFESKSFSSSQATDGQRPELVVVTTTGGVTEVPPRLHNIKNQFATIIASRLGGHIE